MKKYLYPLFLAALLSSASLIGQTAYTLNAFSADYQDLENDTPLVTTSWDDPDFVVPLGFSMTVGNTTSNTLFVNNNFLGGTFIMNPINPEWDLLWATSIDLCDAGYMNDELLSPISYVHDEIDGVQVCKIQWKNAGTYEEVVLNETSNNLLNIQFWVYADGSFETRFGPNTVKETQYILNDWNTCGVLLDATPDNQFSSGYFASGSPSTPELVAGTTMDELFNVQLLGIPANGQVYRFEPGSVSVTEAIQPETKVYPSITNDVVNLQTTHSEALNYMVYDLNGRMLEQGLFQGNTRISLGRYATGMYLVLVEGEQYRKHFRIQRQ